MTSAPDTPIARAGLVTRLARWSIDHRRAVVIAWVLLLVAGVALTNAVGNRFDNGLSLPGSGSQRASDVLSSRFATQAGDADQIVFATRGRSKITDAAVREAALPMLDRIRRLPHVAAVSSPYAGRDGAPTISRDRRIAFATVRFDEQGDALPASAIERVVKTAEAIRSPALQVELNGDAIEQLQRPSVGPATAVGIAAAIVILVVTLGSFLAMGLPITTALFGLGAGSGLIAIGSRFVTVPDFAQQIALMIALGVGVDYALLIVTRYRDAYRENGGDVRAAVEVAMATAGRSITFAGLTVVIALGGLYAVGVNLLYGVAIAATTSVLLVLAGSLTLLPALLSIAGHRVGEARDARSRRPSRRERPSRSERWVTLIQRRPAVAAIGATAVLVALAAPALGLRLALSDAGTDQPSTTTRKAYDLVARGFGAGANGPLVVAVRLPAGGGTATLDRLTTALRRTPGVAAVAAPQLNAARDTASLTVVPTSAPESSATYELVRRLRASTLPAATSGTNAQAYVGGFTATQVDFTDQLSSKLPVFIGIVLALSAVLLLIVFRSLLIPLQAVVMNVLSIAASLGVVTAIFERGWLNGALGIQKAPVEPFLPVLLFAIVFGLSMDYEVFLVSRIREEWQRTGDHSAGIRGGLMRTGRVITAAAAVMVVVFASFAANGGHVLQLFGIGLATAILVDAVVVRMILLPAVLELLGDATWKLPRGLDRHLPRVALESRVSTEPQTQLEPAR
jgi:putative drug exporter of the RND superfamily